MEQLQNLKTALADQDAVLAKLSDKIKNLEDSQAVDLADVIKHVEDNNTKMSILLGPSKPIGLELDPVAPAESVAQDEPKIFGEEKIAEVE